MIDNTSQNILIVLLLLYGIGIIAYSYYFYRKTKTYDGYSMGGRAMPLLPMILTIVGGAVGGSTLLGFMTDAYQFGMGQIWNVISLVLSVVIFILIFLKKIRIAGDKYKLSTVGDYAAIRFGKAARYPTFIGNLAAIAALAGLQFVALAGVLNLIFGLNITTGIIISFLFLTVKTFLGGLTAVIWTDAVQGTIQTIGITSLFLFIYISTGGWENIADNVSNSNIIGSINPSEFLNPFNIPLGEILIPFLTIGAAILVRQDNWQRVWAAKDMNTIIKANWWSIVIIFFSGVFIIVLGVIAATSLGINTSQPNLIYYEIIFGHLPFWFGAIMLITLMATILSIADTFIISGSTMIVNDLIKPLMKHQTDSKLLAYSRSMVFVMGLLSMILALAIPRLVELWMTGSAILVSGILAPILLGLLWKKPNNIAGVASMWSGLIVAISWQLLGHPFGLHPVFLGLPISIIVLLVLTLIPVENKEYELESN